MLIDSNIIIYAINVSSPKHKVAQQFLQANISSITIAHQNIFESLRVLTHSKFQSPMQSEDAIVSVTQIMKASRVIAPTFETHHITLEFIKKHKLSADQIFDAYLAATALSNGIVAIATDNIKDFRKFDLELVNPFS